MRIVRAPRKGKLGARGPQVPRDRVQLLHGLDESGKGGGPAGAGGNSALERIGTKPLVSREGQPGVLGNARIVFAGEKACRQWAPDRQSEAELLIQPLVLLLHPPPNEQVVLRLFHLRLVQVVLLRKGPCFHELVRVPFGGPPVQGLAGFQHHVHGPDRFLDGRFGVRAMAVDEVDVLQAEALQRAVDSLPELLAVQGGSFVDPVMHAEEDLGGHDVARPAPPQLAKRGSHDLFRASRLVGFGVVEEVHPLVPGGLHACGGRIDVHLPPVGHPRAERESAHLQTRASQSPILHFSLLSLRPCGTLRAAGSAPARPRPSVS